MFSYAGMKLTIVYGSLIHWVCALFSIRSFYRKLEPFSGVWPPCASVWMGLAPPRVEAFCWLAVAGKISTTDMLRRGWCRIPFQKCAAFLGGRWSQ